MRKTASAIVILCAVVGLQAPLSLASRASDGAEEEELDRQEGEDRWVPSLAITAGATIHPQEGSVESFQSFPDTAPTPVPLRVPASDDALAVAPFVGASLELMTPALPIPTRPRLFVSGEILPTFASDYGVAVDGNPSCIKGPEPDAVCARDEPVDDMGIPLRPFGTQFGEASLNGQGSRTTARVEDLAFGATLGAAWPFRIGERQLRIKPSVAWIHYEVSADGIVVDGSCNPVTACTPTDLFPDFGHFRERSLEASGSKKFHAIGPGLDLEMDTGRFGPLGSSIFLGGRAYRVLGNRSFTFEAIEEYEADAYFPHEIAEAHFGVEVDPWVYRAQVGFRLQWLGSRK